MSVTSVVIVNESGEACGQYNFDTLLNEAYRPDILHQVIRWQGMKRKMPHAAKTRGEINYSNRKLYSQRRSGRARRGAFGAPQTRGGGVAFAPRPVIRDFGCPKNMRRHALRIALTRLVQESNLVIIKNLNTIHKTNIMNQLLTKFEINRRNRALIISPTHHLAARSLPIADTLPIEGLNLRSIMRCSKVFLAEECVDEAKRRLRI